MLDRLLKFINIDIWMIETHSISKWKAFWIKLFRALILISHGFTSGKISLWASALTYYTLISIVPVIAILIGIARGFKMEATLKDWIFEKFSDQKEIVSKIVDFAQASLDNAGRGVIAGIGIVLLIWAIIKILRNMEEAFNTTWEVGEMRPIGRQFTDYLALMLLAPLFILLTSGATVFLTTFITNLENKSIIVEKLGPILLFFVSLFSYLLSFLTFTFLYKFMPNAKVRFSAAFIAGILAGSIYQLVQWIYITFQIGLSQYNAVYGTFAALPFFLIWVQLSWMIVLLGAKISFITQNLHAFELMPQNLDLSLKKENIYSLALACYCIKDNAEDKPPPSNLELTKRVSLPLILTNKFLNKLEAAGILSRVKTENDSENFYIPGKNINHLSIQHVLKTLKEFSKGSFTLKQTDETNVIQEFLDRFDEQNEKSKINILLKDI